MNAVYLKKDINWENALFSSNLSRVSKLISDRLGLSLRRFRKLSKDSCIKNWESSGLKVIRNDDTDIENRVFYSDETLLKASKYDWIIIMDDDDFLINPNSQLNEIPKEFNSVIWQSHEYNFVTGEERFSSFLSDGDRPSGIKREIILPGTYAIRGRLLDKLIKESEESEIVNFFSALDCLQFGKSKIKVINSPVVVRPYTVFSEYYLFSQELNDFKTIDDVTLQNYTIHSNILDEVLENHRKSRI